MDQWAEAHSELVRALEKARDAGVGENEAMSAVDDVYHESDEHYEPGPRKPKT